jgi:flagellar operon protein (TIGR03826 family)
MPEIKNCSRCNKIFMYVSGLRLCDSCKKLDEEDFERVRQFVRDFPGATIPEVSKETGVPSQMIYRYLKEGKLEVSESSPIALLCENCGKRIKSGRFCVDCSKRLANEMITAGKSLREDYRKNYGKPKKEEAGLRYLHGERKKGED